MSTKKKKKLAIFSGIALVIAIVVTLVAMKAKGKKDQASKAAESETLSMVVGKGGRS